MLARHIDSVIIPNWSNAMKTIASILALLLFLCIEAGAFAADYYLCIADMATGFAFDKENKSWHPTPFKQTINIYF